MPGYAADRLARAHPVVDSTSMRATIVRNFLFIGVSFELLDIRS
jgi:tRNA threonylcarbamoyladenosine modification (KEOPS) complex  Pcc1 subunit